MNRVKIDVAYIVVKHLETHLIFNSSQISNLFVGLKLTQNLKTKQDLYKDFRITYVLIFQEDHHLISFR